MITILGSHLNSALCEKIHTFLEVGAKCKKCAVFPTRIGAEVSTHKKKHSSQGGHNERKIKDLGEMVGEETTILNVFSPSTSTSHFEEKPKSSPGTT